jgi:micrococcal nuclease
VALIVGGLAWDRYSYILPLEEITGPAAEQVTQPIYVHDGDTIRIGRERIRIIGLDTPEIGSGARCAAEQRGAVAARAELERMLFRAKVTIRRDGTDRYGRTLAYVYADGKNVARELISMGLARPYMGGVRDGWCE